MKPFVTVFLQNAWSPDYAGTVWPRASWLRAMWRSRSGNKVAKLLKSFKHGEAWIDNTTPICGDTPSSIVPPDIDHINSVLVDTTPDVVVACGQQAGNLLKDLWKGSLLVIPHPACRVVTNALYERANRMLLAGFDSRAALVQLPGEHRRVKL